MQQVGFIHFIGGVEELFDIEVLPDVREPFIIGFEEELIDSIEFRA